MSKTDFIVIPVVLILLILAVVCYNREPPKVLRTVFPKAIAVAGPVVNPPTKADPVTPTIVVAAAKRHLKVKDDVKTMRKHSKLATKKVTVHRIVHKVVGHRAGDKPSPIEPVISPLDKPHCGVTPRSVRDHNQT